MNLDSDPGNHGWRGFVGGWSWGAKCQGGLKHWKLDPMLHFSTGELKETVFPPMTIFGEQYVCWFFPDRIQLQEGNAAPIKDECDTTCRHAFHCKVNPEVPITALIQTDALLPDNT